MSRPMALAALRPLARSHPVVLPSSAALVVRFASTSTSSPSASPSSSSASPGPSQSTGPLPLSWPQYLSLRRQRRLWSTLTSVPTTFAGLFLGGGYFASLEADPSQLIMGIEPMFVYGGATGNRSHPTVLGYLLGPTLGASLFSLTHRSIFRGNPAPFEVMDRAFFEHIKRNRVSPVFQSVNNPSPDYYGEKIVSLPTYRRWLRDQAAYKRKAMHGVPDEQL
ncbi:Presequence translocated-associated motor subunit PAM17, mitochondrial [Saitozyma sp. JCM 24511]|nr:Presequence translocated-associated motor subunit PAM17, mitochondrial [Saitozyma sp. JCM 24511]